MLLVVKILIFDFRYDIFLVNSDNHYQ